MTEESFLTSSLMRYLSTPGSTLLYTERGLIDGHVGDLSIIGFYDHDTAVLQLSVAAAGVGHLIRCRGSLIEFERTVATCSSLMREFTLKINRIH